MKNVDKYINKKNVTYVITLIVKLTLSLSFSISFMNYMDKDIRRTKIMLLVFVSTVIVFFWLYYYKPKDKKTRDYSLIYSIVYSFVLFIGKSVNSTNSIERIYQNANNLIIFIINVVSFSLVLTTIVEFVFINLNTNNNSNNKINKKKAILIWALVFISWIPCYISYYPGVWSYDSPGQIEQATGLKEYTQWQTPTHTFYIQLCIMFGRLIKINPIVIYSISQMLILSYSFKTFITYLMNQEANKWIVVLSIIFFCLNPVFALFSFMPTKDVLSAAFFLLAITRGFELKNGKLYMVLFVIDVVLSCLFRHNVFYAFLLSLIVILIINYKRYKETIVLTFVSLIVVVFINGPLFNLLNIKKDNNQEYLSIPLQQLATTAYRREYNLNEEQLEQLNKYLFSIESIKKYYNPRFADGIKANFDKDYYLKNREDFWKLWFDLLTKYPLDYIDAFLSLNISYWYQDAKIPDPYANRTYIETWSNKEIKIDDFDQTRMDGLPMLNRFYENFANYNIETNTLFIPDLFSLALPFWLILLAIFKTILNRNHNNIPSLILMIMLWLTLMAGPVSNTRYILSLIVMYPYLVCLLIQKEIKKH